MVRFTEGRQLEMRPSGYPMGFESNYKSPRQRQKREEEIGLMMPSQAEDCGRHQTLEEAGRLLGEATEGAWSS